MLSAIVPARPKDRDVLHCSGQGHARARAVAVPMPCGKAHSASSQQASQSPQRKADVWKVRLSLKDCAVNGRQTADGLMQYQRRFLSPFLALENPHPPRLAPSVHMPRSRCRGPVQKAKAGESGGWNVSTAHLRTGQAPARPGRPTWPTPRARTPPPSSPPAGCPRSWAHRSGTPALPPWTCLRPSAPPAL